MKDPAKISLKLRRLPIPEKVKIARKIVVRMKGNAHFPSPNPSLTAVTKAINELQEVFTPLVKGSKLQTSVRKIKNAALNRLLTLLGSYVEDIANGNRAIILSAGMPLRKTYRLLGKLPQPQNMRAENNNKPKEMWLICNPVKGAWAYCFQLTPTPVGNFLWQPAGGKTGCSTKAKLHIKNLHPGREYAFRCIVIGAAGESIPSEIVIRRSL